MKIHLDLDCFFAAAHRIDNPALENIPIAVGGRSNTNIFDSGKKIRHLSKVNGAFTSSLLSCDSDRSFKEYFVDENGKVRGIITTSSYEARAYGVKTAMSVSEALRLCPHLTMIPPNYPLYHDLSNRLKLLLEKEIPIIEQFSIDEFFGDITGWIKDEDVVEFAVKLKQKIKDELKLPISIGIANTKWIAKLATNDAKPYGVKRIFQEDLDSYVKDKPLKSFPGIGPAFQDKLKGYGVKTLGDIKYKKELFYSWGKSGQQIYDRVCGIDNEAISAREDKKSIGLGRTFDPISCRDEIKRRLIILCRHLSFIAHKSNHKPSTFGLNIKYQYGATSKDSLNSNRVFSEQFFKEQIINMFSKIDNHPSHLIVQLNISLGNFRENKPITLDLLNLEKDTKLSNLTTSMQKLRDKFGVDIIKSGSEL